MTAGNPRVFISYARGDGEAFAGTLRARLEAAGIPLWQDRTGMEGGRDWWLQITAALDRVRFMVLVMTPAAMASELVRREWRYARQRGVAVYPVMGAAGLDFARLPRWMRDAHCYDLAHEWEKFLRDLDSTWRPPRVPFMAEDQPRDFIERPAEMALLKRLLLDQEREEPIAITTALRGAGGFGKTALARALCHDEDIQNAFDDGILWVTLGQSPGDVTGRVEDLIYLLSGERPGFASLEAATARFTELINDRDILIVIDDAWNAVHARPFLQGGPRCARLITSRMLDALPAGAQRVDVDAMRTAEALALLGFALPPGCQQELARLAARLGEWPLLLKLVGGALADRVAAGQSLASALAYVNKALDRRGLTFFDAADVASRHQAVSHTLEVSLAQLSPAERARYQELAVFPADAAIPLATVEALWSRTGGLDDFDTEALCDRLNRLSLVVSFDATARQVRLHDVVRRYLETRCEASLPGLHATLLDALRPASGRWAGLPADEPYLWEHLVYHLNGAGRTEELLATVQDLDYLASKTLVRSALAVEADLARAAALAPGEAALVALQRSFVAGGHILNGCRTASEAEATLLSRVRHVPELAAIVAGFVPRHTGPRLTAWHALPDLPHPALVRTLTGHVGTVWACAVSPDRSFFVSAGYDGSVRVWDAATGAERHNLVGHTAWVKACAVSGDGSLVVSAGNDRKLRLWDAASGKLLRTLAGHTDGVTDCAISPDGAMIVSASLDETLRVWDTATGEVRQVLAGKWARTQWGVKYGEWGHWGTVHACAIAADGSFIVSGSADQTLKLWRPDSALEVATLTGHTAAVTGCAISPDGSFIVSASADRTLIVWGRANGTQRHVLSGHRHLVTRCAISPDGLLIFSASADGTLKVWDAATGNELVTFHGHTDWANACAVFADGSGLLSASSDGTLKIWDLRGDWRQSRSRVTPRLVNACALAPDGATLVTASIELALHLWSVESGVVRRVLLGHDNAVRGCAFDEDGSLLASASADKTVRLWDRTTRREISPLLGHRDWVNDCAFVPGTDRLVSVSGDGTIRVWSVAGQVRLLTIRAHRDAINACSVSRDGTFLVTASADQTLKVWDLRIPPDVWTLLVSQGKPWDAAAASTQYGPFVLKGHTRGVNACAIAPDGRFIVSASDDRTLKVWDRLSERRTLAGHEGWVNGCAISPDGTLLASVSEDHSVKVWNLADGACLATLRVDGALADCVWLPDGERLIAVGVGGVYFLRLVR